MRNNYHIVIRKTQRSSFALLLTLIVVTALSTSTVALSLLSSTEFARSLGRAADLDHQLALQSVVRLLPELIGQTESQTRSTTDRQQHRIIEVTLGDCSITILAREESSKRQVTSGNRSQDLERSIRHLIHANGLPLDSISMAPIVNRENVTSLPQYVWFEQIIQASGFEDIFPWHRRWSSNDEKKTTVGLSDLITFWGDRSSSRWGLHVVTNIQGDRRQWFVVADINQRNSTGNIAVRVPW